jgi:hypothetical protein
MAEKIPSIFQSMKKAIITAVSLIILTISFSICIPLVRAQQTPSARKPDTVPLVKEARTLLVPDYVEKIKEIVNSDQEKNQEKDQLQTIILWICATAILTLIFLISNLCAKSKRITISESK